MTDYLCRIDDAYTADSPRWVIKLNDGDIIYQDDDRPGIPEKSAWKRLREYCYTHEKYIVELWLQFRSNRVLITPTDADGYFFVKSSFAVSGDIHTNHAFIVGVVHGEQIVTYRYMVPALVLLGTENRLLDRESPCVILRNGY